MLAGLGAERSLCTRLGSKVIVAQLFTLGWKSQIHHAFELTGDRTIIPLIKGYISVGSEIKNKNITKRKQNKKPNKQQKNKNNNNTTRNETKTTT